MIEKEKKGHEKHSSSNSVFFMQESIMQETHTTEKSQEVFRAQWRGDMIFSHGTSSARGVCIAFRPNLEKKILSQPVCDDIGRYINVYMEIQGSAFVLVNCYAPNTDSSQVKLFKKILAQLCNFKFDQDSQFILTRYKNLLFDTFWDSLGGKHQLNKISIFHLKILMEDLELVDIWRVRNPTFRQFRWSTKVLSKCVVLTFS